jgi:hypothetical protein
MDWTQTFTIIGSITASMIAVWYAFYNITDKRIDRMEGHHREDMKRMDDAHREDVQRMELKWERLFERLLIQDQKKSG